jgi:hypothetical protein
MIALGCVLPTILQSHWTVSCDSRVIQQHSPITDYGSLSCICQMGASICQRGLHANLKKGARFYSTPYSMHRTCSLLEANESQVLTKRNVDVVKATRPADLALGNGTRHQPDRQRPEIGHTIVCNRSQSNLGMTHDERNAWEAASSGPIRGVQSRGRGPALPHSKTD